LPSELQARDIPFEILDGTELPDPAKVSVLTVHQSKGYEFDVVLLMALEALPKMTDDPERGRRCRVGFVGPTRARDQLIITYTRPNEFLRNIRECSERVLRGWNFPDDYEGV
jgi:superfamily I DNA/RNA helicase